MSFDAAVAGRNAYDFLLRSRGNTESAEKAGNVPSDQASGPVVRPFINIPHFTDGSVVGKYAESTVKIMASFSPLQAPVNLALAAWTFSNIPKGTSFIKQLPDLLYGVGCIVSAFSQPFAGLFHSAEAMFTLTARGIEQAASPEKLTRFIENAGKVPDLVESGVKQATTTVENLKNSPALQRAAAGGKGAFDLKRMPSGPDELAKMIHRHDPSLVIVPKSSAEFVEKEGTPGEYNREGSDKIYHLVTLTGQRMDEIIQTEAKHLPRELGDDYIRVEFPGHRDQLSIFKEGAPGKPEPLDEEREKSPYADDPQESASASVQPEGGT